MNTENSNLEVSLANYDEAVAEIIKMLDFLPDNEMIRKQYLAMVVSRLLML